MKPYVSLFTPDFIYVWMEVFNDERELFLDNISPLGQHPDADPWSIPKPSNFLKSVLRVNGWEDYFVDFYDDQQQWLIENGISPCQPFLVKFYYPRGYRTWTDMGYEYDCDYEYEIVAVEPWKLSKVRTVWKSFLRNQDSIVRKDMK